MRLAVAGAAVAVLVLAASAGSDDTFAVHVVSQTSTTITLGWSAQPGYGYLFSAGGKIVSRTNDPNRATVRFSKVTPASYDVDVLTKGSNGHYPGVVVQPPPPKAQCEDGVDNDNDGKTDYPADPGCDSSSDNDETNVVPPPQGQCANTTPNTPDGPDGNGGCFPGTSNTGPNKPAADLSTYTGSCNITSPNVTIDSMVVNCRVLNISSGGTGFTLRNSYLNGGITQSGTPQFTVEDSLVDSGIQYPAASTGAPAGKYACGDPGNATTDCGITGTNYTILRTEVINSNRAAYCEAPGPCLVQDSYFHGTNLWPDKSNLAHASSMREEQNATIRHNTLWCSYTGPFPNGEIGCSANLTGYPDFAPIKNNTVDRNLFVASPGSSFCAYGGGSATKPYSGDPTNATNQKFTNNVFQRGTNNKCGAYGPITDFKSGNAGNVWSGNVWSDGGTVQPG